jgi:hypothetical protein
MLRVQSSIQKEPFQQLQEEVNTTVEGANAARKVNRLLQVLCENNIQSVAVVKRERDVGVVVNLKKHQYKRLDNTVLHIPRTLKFGIHQDGICFDSDLGKDTPYEDNNSCCGLLKNRLTWWDIIVKGDEFEFYSPRWVGLCLPICGGTPNVYGVNAEKLIENISSD